MWQSYGTAIPAAVLLHRPYLVVCYKAHGAWHWYIRDLRVLGEPQIVERGRGTYARSSRAQAAAEAALSTRADVTRQDY